MQVVYLGGTGATCSTVREGTQGKEAARKGVLLSQLPQGHRKIMEKGEKHTSGLPHYRNREFGVFHTKSHQSLAVG